MSDPDPDLAAAVDKAMVDALDDLGPLLRDVAGDSPWVQYRPTAGEIVDRMRRNGIDDPEK